MIRLQGRRDDGPRVIDPTKLVQELSRLRATLSPDLAVIADALSYCVVAVDHLLMHAHDDEPTEH